MTARVIFLNQFYYPDPDEQERLDELQEKLEIYLAEIAYQSRDFNPFQRMVFKEKSHQNVRKSWRLIGGKE